MPIDITLLNNIKNNTFTDSTLFLAGLGLGDDDVSLLVNAIQQSSCCMATLKKLDISFNNITGKGAQLLATLDCLQTLDISSNEISFEESKTLTEEIKALAKSKLQKLNISANLVGDFIGELSSSVNLTELIAAQCHITDLGANELFKSRHILKLNLSTNYIIGASLNNFVSNATLKNLSLSQNGLSSGFFDAISKNKTLTSLNLTNVFVEKNHVKLLASNYVLTELNLTQCYIDDDGVQALSQSNTITTLELSNNRITDKGVDFLAENNNILKLGLNSNDGVSLKAEKKLADIYSDNSGGVFSRSKSSIEHLKKTVDSGDGVTNLNEADKFFHQNQQMDSLIIPRPKDTSPPEKDRTKKIALDDSPTIFPNTGEQESPTDGLELGKDARPIEQNRTADFLPIYDKKKQNSCEFVHEENEAKRTCITQQTKKVGQNDL